MCGVGVGEEGVLAPRKGVFAVGGCVCRQGWRMMVRRCICPQGWVWCVCWLEGVFFHRRFVCVCVCVVQVCKGQRSGVLRPQAVRGGVCA